MYRKLNISLARVILVSIILLNVVSISSAVTYIVWDNQAGDADWNNGLNWNTDTVPPNNSGYYARVNISTGPVVTIGQTANVYRIYLDGAGNGTLTVNDGIVNVSSHIYVAPTAVDRGTLNVSGGTLNIASTATLYIGRDAGSIGTVNLSGGTIYAGGLSMRYSDGTGTINISGDGKIVLDGDDTAIIEPYITDGWITGYGGKGTVHYDYNISNSGKTTIWATISNNATSPKPVNGATDLMFMGLNLGWKAGVSAASHDIYFGTEENDVNSAERLNGDIDASGIVDFCDVSILTNYWLSNPAGSEPYAGVNSDSIVDFDDYALLAQNWLALANPAFFGNQDANTFTPGVILPATTYHWRIDEVNGPNTIKGSTWSFTTQSGLPFNPIPGDGALTVNTDINLTWLPSITPQSYNIYFGTTNPPAFRINQMQTTYNPGILSTNTTYYWRVDQIGAFGTIVGDLWTFTTAADAQSNYTLVGKVMCGYQGWFNCPGDGTNRGWVHWGPGNFSSVSCTVDMWPDMTETGPAEKFLASGFSDGNDYYVFSSAKRDTVLRHFLWMSQYGIDGVFLQRFGTELFPGSEPLAHRNAVLSYCKEGANTYSKKYAVMYDLTSLAAGTVVSTIENDWKSLIDTGKIVKDGSDSALMFHNGKPVVAVWGIGWTDTSHPYSWAECLELINFLKDDPIYGGCTVMVGVRDRWRSSYIGDPTMLAIVTKADIISPWTIGGYSSGGVSAYGTSKWIPDKNWCNSHGKDYMPVIWPGYSFKNKSGDPTKFNSKPRYGGQFLWDQVKTVITNVGTNMIYVAMFDEVDEGTAIFKVSNNPPRPGGADMFVTYNMDGYSLPSDEYLWLTGQAARALRGEISPVPSARPGR